MEGRPFLSAGREQETIMEWNNTFKEYTLDKCLHQLIEEQVRQNPDKPAVLFEDERVSFSGLNSRSNQCARYLRGMGVGPDCIVGVLMERSIEMVIALLAILKAGGAYLPLDPTYPEGRLMFMLEDAGVSIVLTQERHMNLIKGFEGTRLCLDSEWDYLSEEPDGNLLSITTPENLAYVIYTSGSTGKPKGCMLPHVAICNRLLWMQDKYLLTDQDRVLQKTPFTFDVSVWEFFWPLLSGACLVVAKPEGHRDSNYLVDIIRKERITTCHFVPSMLRYFVSNPNVTGCDTLRQVFTSGEALSFDLMMDFKSKLAAKLHNLYGPTEAAVDVTYWECEERADKKVPIGRPISNIQMYILDSDLNQVPIGQEGELHIGGIGLARGYLNRPELTAERFINNPFSAEIGSKLYKTGDKSRFLPDGNIEYLGRMDFQVKLRGNRIELGEIETVLRDHEAIEEAVVLVKDEESEDPKLVAYIVVNGEPLSSKQVRQFVKNKLPGYMVPNIIVPLDSIPVTQHGKLDRKMLPWPIKERVNNKPPEESLRESISAVLSEYLEKVLDTAKIAFEDDLFDLGATSLTMVRMVEMIHKKYGVSIPVEVFLNDPTINAITRYLCEKLDEKGDTCQIVACQSQMAKLCENSVIELNKVHFKEVFYKNGAIVSSYIRKEIPYKSFSGLLSLLRKETINGDSKYLYPSAGGLNAVQTYLYIKENAVEGIKEGIYYYHPEEHGLYLINGQPVIDRSIFFEYHRPVFDNAGFVLFLIARLKAIEPVYQMSSPLLVTLDAGYMGQLLLSRQADFNLGLCPVAGVDFDSIGAFFELDESHRFIHCILGGTPDRLSAGDDLNEPDKGMAGYIGKTGISITGHLQNYTGDKTFASFLDLDWKTVLKNMKSLSKEEHELFHAKHLNVRRPSGTEAVIALDRHHFPESDYLLRSSKREYLEKPVSFDQFSKFLSILRSVNKKGSPRHLYPSLSGMHGIEAYLYIKENGVEGLAQGVYHYNSADHALVLITGDLSKKVKPSYTPFNRKHYQKSRFCLFLVGQINEMKSVYKDESRYLALLEAGYIGQLLMDRQSEFGIGVCPIGGMDFDRLRPDFKLEDGQELLHSFICGGFEQDIPEDREFLEIGRGEARTKIEFTDRVPAKNKKSAQQQDIAIVGISGRYPGAGSLEEYWENLLDGKNSISRLPDSRRKLWRQHPADAGREMPSIRGGYLDDIDCFDSLLFNISPPECRTMDPQERLLMEVTWECLENAGYTAENLVRSSGDIGVFVGVMWSDYQNQRSNLCGDMPEPRASAFHSSIANRLSYYFNFSGPSIALDTSCSSAMTAIHFACESIKRGECAAALIGGVNLMTHYCHLDLLTSHGLLSKDGQCRPFGSLATGWLAGEGVGAILIKPIEDALRDRDHIHGIIKGTAIGHSGRTARFGAPSSAMQSEAIKKAIKNAGVTADSISYVEAAAAGAGIADAAEMDAIKTVFQDHFETSSPCFIGSVKANIGHLESASAMSQITKVLLQMKHRQVAPTINFEPVNPLIQLQGSGLEIVDQMRPWSCPPPLRALINSFGATGSGGYLILEEYICKENKKRKNVKPVLIPISAAAKEQLYQQVSRLYDFLTGSETESFDIADIGYTLRMGRAEMDERLAVVVENTQSLVEKLEMFLRGEEKIAGLYRGSVLSGEGPDVKNGGDLFYIAGQWVQGAAVSWDDLNDGSERRIPLSTYPFAKMRHWLWDHPDKTLQQSAGLETGDSTLLTRMEDYLKNVFSGVSEIPERRINAQAPLEKYGINSLLINKLNSRLEKDFGELSKTLFYEYQSIHDLANYFMKYHRDKLSKLPPACSEPGGAPPDEGPQMRAAERRDRYVSLACSFIGEKSGSDIAIIGLAGRYPKSGTVRDYWENIKNGVDCITEIPVERWDYQKYYGPGKQTPGRTYCKWGGFIEHVDKFDPLFFNISPREAEIMDPQERLFLETVWHTLEDAGYSRQSLREASGGKVGVFVGVMYGEYQLLSDLNYQGGDKPAIVSSYGSIANRASYFFDFHGPSMAVDTLCSSSLTALHLAAESIKRGECEAAIAGGVNISLHPNKYILQAQLAMSSADGRCRSFGEGGDGIVPGEGVGAVLLKPLPKAVRDGDHIYGVIKGTSVNHGGKTNGYTVPNPVAQSNLILEALKKAEVHPRTISYVEAHGTGTSLGDPIEVTGLSKSFNEYTSEKQYCPIGSVKSNIGHLESAAGIAGLTKVLLQIKYKQLAPSLHSERLNPNINFENTPFFVQRELTDWEQPAVEIDGQSGTCPRRASVSSFGAGGANAHVVIEEYEELPEQREMPDHDLPVIILLSARNEDRLREQVRQLLEAIRDGQLKDDCLADMAYTLQVGREGLEERLAVMAGSVTDLEEKLKLFIEGQNSIKDLYRGRVKEKESLIAFGEDEDLRKAIDAWISKRKYAKILDLWAEGLIIDWNSLYGDTRPRRISLPAYPFARERYWAPGAGTGTAVSATDNAAMAASIHPLLQQNTSSLLEQRFSSTFTGREFFLADHVVKGRRVLPGVAYLEMAREAVEQAVGDMKEGKTGVQLKNVVWARPIAVGEHPVRVHIGLYPEDSGEIAYEIYSRPEEPGGEPVIYSQGSAVLNYPGEVPTLDLKGLREQCSPKSLSSSRCYQAFRAMGLEYGPGHQGIEEVLVGSGQVLAKLSLPSSISETQGQFVLHPSMLDSALQSSIGLFINAGDAAQPGGSAPIKPSLPFALQELEVFGHCTSAMWALIRH
ncbi:MAG TPA: polyketide synthase, partial [Desulfotomaculum sp.]|nr:polyketide synthase [Desulfotomaculum sp.]